MSSINMKQTDPTAWLEECRGKDFTGSWPTMKEMFDLTVKRYPNNNCFTDFDAKKEKQSTFTDRYEGRTINYKNDEAPKFWIKKAAGSGANFSFDALNITNDMDRTGKPATANVQISFADLIHSAKLTVDTRESSKEPLILANYNCDGLPLDYPTSKFGDAPGVPGIKTDSNLDFVMKIYEDDGFDITGTGNHLDYKCNQSNDYVG